jgi:hypothetical protein
MNERTDAVSNPGVQGPSLLLACFGFAASTTTIIGLMTALGSLA